MLDDSMSSRTMPLPLYLSQCRDGTGKLLLWDPPPLFPLSVSVFSEIAFLEPTTYLLHHLEPYPFTFWLFIHASCVEVPTQPDCSRILTENQTYFSQSMGRRARGKRRKSSFWPRRSFKERASLPKRAESAQSNIVGERS